MKQGLFDPFVPDFAVQMKSFFEYTFWLTLLMAILVGPANSTAENPSPEITKARIQLLNGSSIRGTILTISPEGVLSGKNIPNGLLLDQVVSAQTDRSVMGDGGAELTLHLVGGGHLIAKIPRVANEVVEFNSQSGLNKLKLEFVKSLVWVDSPKVREQMASPSPDRDRVIVQTDSGVRVVEGLLESLNETHVELNYKGKSRKISISIVNAIVGADLGLKPPPGPLASVTLIDGSLLRGKIVRLENGTLTMELNGRNTIALPTERIIGFTIKSDNLVYLSDMEPIEVVQRAPFVVQRNWQRDRSILGQSLKLNFTSKSKTVDYEKGIGTQSFSRLVFENENAFTRFRAIVGIDAETKGRGDCQMSVLGDGVRLWSERITAANDPVPVSVDISGMRQIALVVEPGEQFDLSDHADWAMARFTKSN